MAKENIFVAYAASPEAVGVTIEEAVGRLRTYGGTSRAFETWRELDIPGRFIADGVLGKIDQATFVVADITRLNFNVVFEIGYTIGRGKRAFIVMNSALSPPDKEITRLGMFDTLGYHKYANSIDLAATLKKAGSEPQTFPQLSIDSNAPVFVVDTHYKTDASSRCARRLRMRESTCAFLILKNSLVCRL